MPDILETIAGLARERVKKARETVPDEIMAERALNAPEIRTGRFSFENALKKPGMSFICECKKASPSKGIIAEDFDYMNIARSYERAGADCISVLTEPHYFLGSTEYLREISAGVGIPCIRKDFVVDEYMIREARADGAAAVLLICAITGEKKLKEYIELCDSLGLSALVEAHGEDEIKKALSAGARVVGVNNRNLKDFSVSTDNAVNLRKFVPGDVVFVAESGIKTARDVKVFRDAGADAVLIGETLMRAPDKGEMLRELKSLL